MPTFFLRALKWLSKFPPGAYSNKAYWTKLCAATIHISDINNINDFNTYKCKKSPADVI